MKLKFLIVMGLCFFNFLFGYTYEHMVQNSIYLLHDLDIATEILIKEQDVFYSQVNTIELTGALCEVLGRLVMLNHIFASDELLLLMASDNDFWIHVQERIANYLEKFLQMDSDKMNLLIIHELTVWNSFLMRLNSPII